ncbi:hypothetical protein BB560_000027 [Smittium megazygosporum]|uniref:Aromatic amino acid beta-eliminating lyase/threonine aldolase domain-containing protein n=1 Tax=Smittium megazygosporum TaxID=133381 RepID=A0A2T9ZLI0_9FUNG|nr:hypothetical protein BB560_000027 [Smittium megazygosporum]
MLVASRAQLFKRNTIFRRLYSHFSNESKDAAQARIKYDMRSDTVTKPTPKMFERIFSAKVGDDVYGEDFSVIELEKRMAELCGKEAGMFCASGTMSNQIGILANLSIPPFSILCDVNAHINVYEAGGIAFHSRASTTAVKPANDKYLTLPEVKSNYIQDYDDVHCAPTRLICLENTINGVVNGARLWNASVEAGFSFKDISQYFDSLSVCFSKGLGAPVGSILIGEKRFIHRARHLRKLFGGGTRAAFRRIDYEVKCNIVYNYRWRQAGILAEAAQYCIDNHLPLLKEDHKRAKALATELEKLGIGFAHPVETNMVFADFSNTKLDAIKIAEAIEEAGVLIMPYSETVARIVFHHQVGDDASDIIISTLKRIL